MYLQITKCTPLQIKYLMQLRIHMDLTISNTGEPMYEGSAIYNEITSMLRDKQYFKMDGQYYNNWFKKFGQVNKFKFKNNKGKRL